MKLDVKTIPQLKLPEGKMNLIYWDEGLSGYGLQATAHRRQGARQLCCAVYARWSHASFPRRQRDGVGVAAEVSCRDNPLSHWRLFSAVVRPATSATSRGGMWLLASTRWPVL